MGPQRNPFLLEWPLIVSGHDNFIFHDASAPTEWVVIRLSALGDVALTTGVLEYWHRTRGWTFTVITREAFAPVLERHPLCVPLLGSPRRI